MQGHIRRRDAGSWEYTIDVGRAPAQRCQSLRQEVLGRAPPQGDMSRLRRRAQPTDERRRETKGGFATRREAQAAMSKVAVAVEERTHVASSRLTVRDYLTKEWLPAIEHTIRPTTYRSYVAHVECHILPALGSVQLQKLSPAQINALYAKLGRSGKRNGQGLTALSVRHVHAVLHRSLKDAVRWGELARNPADLADPPRVAAHGHELRTWSAEQLAAFLNSQRDDRLYALWHTLAMTGLRRGEALGLRWEDVDLEAGRLAVRRALVPSGREVVVSEPKTARGRRVVALDPETVAVSEGPGRPSARGATSMYGVDRHGPRVHRRRRRGASPRGREPPLSQGREGGDAARYPAARPAPHPRHAGSAGRHPSQGRLGATWPRHRCDHVGHLQSCHPGDAGRGGGQDCGIGVRSEGGLTVRRVQRPVSGELAPA